MTAVNNAYCAMIHGGLALSTKNAGIEVMPCCLRTDSYKIEPTKDIWNLPELQQIRSHNKQHQWDTNPGCRNCLALENNNQQSMRQGMNRGLGIEQQYNLSGPARLDLLFDFSCNLACRTCGPASSTLWQKHLKEHGEWSQPIQVFSRHTEIIDMLTKLDLSNLRQVVLCGGETLMGRAYWEVAAWLAHNVPNAKQQLMLGFQTNGTQPVPQEYHDVIDRVNLVKLNISLDGIGQRFEYLRWPASWNQVVDNIYHMRETAPSNVMFLIEETVSMFNARYLHELDQWARENFSANREGDPVNHSRHFAYGTYSLQNSLTQEYADYLNKNNQDLLNQLDWQENPQTITAALADIARIDAYRGQSFFKTFPELADFYHRYL